MRFAGRMTRTSKAAARSAIATGARGDGCNHVPTRNLPDADRLDGR